MDSLCIRCKGKGLCGKSCKILAKFIDSSPKVKTHFSGSTPPEIFVGRVNYPNVFSGILSPNEHGNTEIMSSSSLWVKNNLPIEKVLEMRGKMIYARQETNIKSQKFMHEIVHQLAMASKPVSTEFFLKKQPELRFESSRIFSIMANPAPIEKVLLQENPFVEKKVDYLVSDSDAKAINSVEELYKNNIQINNIQKLFSVGLLGLKTQRKLVPTRWSITAVDDIISKKLLEKVKYFQEINEILIFSDEYNGNHYEIILLPGEWKFEVIEAWGKKAYGNEQIHFSADYEGFFGRKNYADNVTGAYYANRLAVLEYLQKIKRQASVLVLREISEEYYAPLGVGILRELSRRALEKNPEKVVDINACFEFLKKKLNITFKSFKEKSWLLRDYGKQKKLTMF